MPMILARDLLSQLRETELRYLETIRWQPEFWVERCLSPARIRVIDAVLKDCPADADFLDDAFSERGLSDQIDRIAWQFQPITSADTGKIMALFRLRCPRIAAE